MHDYKEKIGLIASKLLLLTDHDEHVSITERLATEGYSVAHCYCHQFDFAQLDKHQPAAILIDLEHPSVEQVSICRQIRLDYDGPLLILSAPGDEVVQVLALELGADDFLFKPQPNAFLSAKLRAQLRRQMRARRQQKKQVQLGELVIDAARREVWSSGREVSLTTREFDLLWCLAENARNILSRDQIHQSLYNCEYNGFDRSIDIYISRIRQKIGDDPHNPHYLKTVRGSGYLLVEGLPA